MEEIAFPDRIVEKILMLESPGEDPAGVMICLPTIVFINEPFDVRIVVFDKSGYPCFQCSDEVIFDRTPFENFPSRIPFKKRKVAIVTVKNVLCNKKGIFRLSAEFGNKTYFSNPFICQVPSGTRIFWGDPHVHTVLSDCHANKCSSAHFAFTSGRYFSCLDWMAVTDHVSNNRGSLGKWREGMYVAELHNEDGSFITIPGYEASFKSGAGGDNNFYFSKFPDYFIEDYENGTIKSVSNKMLEKAKQQGFEFFAVPHHTSRAVKHGEISMDIYPGHQLMPAIEIYSKWGSSEYCNNPESLIKPHNGPAYVVDFLKKGFIAGFIAGTDTHTSIPSGRVKEVLPYQPGFTAVISDSFTRQGIFNAIKNRKTYATAGERIFINMSVNEYEQGSLVKVKNNPVRKISFSIAAQTDINCLEIVRNGDVIHSMNPGTWRLEGFFEDKEKLSGLYLNSDYCGEFVFYYIRIRTRSNALGWSGPVFLVYNKNQ